MASIYRSGGGSGTGSIYRSGGGGSLPVGSKATGGGKSGGGGGVLGFLGRAGSDLYHAALNAPAGLAQVVSAPILDSVDALTGGDPTKTARTLKVLAGMGKGELQALEHPIAHPGNFALAVLPFGEGAARVGEAAGALRAGEGAGAAVARLANRGEPAPQVFKAGDLTVEAPGSRSALGRAGQKATGNILARSETLTVRRVGKELAKNQKVEEAVARGPASALVAAGRKLPPEQQTALRTVAEGVPTDERIAYHEGRARGVGKAERARHEAKIATLQQSKQYLDETGATPRISPAHPKLQVLYQQAKQVAADRTQLLENIGKMTPEAAQGRISAPGRVIKGAVYEQPINPPGLVKQEQRVAALQREYERQAVKVKAGKVTAVERRQLARPEAPTERIGKIAVTGNGAIIRPQGSARLEQIGAHLSREQDRLAALEKRTASRHGMTVPRLREYRARVQQSALHGGQGFTGGEFRVPYTVKPSIRSLGRPPVIGQQRSIGYPKNPASITKPFTGSLLKHGNFRDDTTRLVGESNLEAQKLAGVLRLRDKLKQAAAPEPLSDHYIPMRLDNLKSGVLKPEERQLLDKIEAGGRLSPDDQKAAGGLYETVRSRVFMKRPVQMTDEERATLHELQQQGKIGWVDRRLLRGLDKPAPSLESVVGRPVARGFDAVNNAQRAAIFYLKPAYALPNILGNVALTLVQQGFAAPAHLARAVRINATLGPEVAARIDELMGEGAARSLAGDHGIGTKAIQAMAGQWSKVIDRPFRRASFLYEAQRAGVKTPEAIAKLVQGGPSPKLVMVTRRANAALIDYANLTPAEREIIRRVVFVYPWIKGSTVYTAQFLRDHPIQASVAGQLGEQGYAKNKRDLGPFPSYFEGAFKVGGSQEYPTVVNPAAAAIMQTPAQVGAALAAALAGHPLKAAESTSFATPAAQLALNLIGQKGLAKSAESSVTSLPQYLLIQRILQGLHGQAQTKLYPPSPGSAAEQFLVGGVAPRKVNALTLHRAAALEQKNR